MDNHAVAAPSLGTIEAGVGRFDHGLRSLLSQRNQRRDANADRDRSGRRALIDDGELVYIAAQSFRDLDRLLDRRVR
jgi:hypothetical protein